MAARAHRVGSPDCRGELELIDDWMLPGDESERSASRRETARDASTTVFPRGA
jgi:hypothetical protein